MDAALAGKAQLKGIETERKLQFFCDRLRLKYRKASGIGLACKS